MLTVDSICEHFESYALRRARYHAYSRGLDVDECESAALEALWTAARKHDGVRSFKPFLCQLIRFTIAQRARWYRAKKRSGTMVPIDAALEIPSTTNTGAALEGCGAVLTPLQREIIRAHYDDGEVFTAVAKRLDLQVYEVRIQHLHALQTLRRKLQAS